jgi:hypothetical protein
VHSGRALFRVVPALSRGGCGVATCTPVLATSAARLEDDGRKREAGTKLFAGSWELAARSGKLQKEAANE